MSKGISLWRIAVEAPGYGADDLTGEGARQTGGRWNRTGLPVIYTASSISLACLETIVHLGPGVLPLNRYLVKIKVPDKLITTATKAQPDRVIGWDALPPGKTSLDWGDTWLSATKSVLARVPSIVVPEEWCVLINPRHPHIGQITARKVRPWTYDARFHRQDAA